MLWDVSEDRHGGLQFRCRLAGTLLVEMLGQEVTGRWLHELFGEETGNGKAPSPCKGYGMAGSACQEGGRLFTTPAGHIYVKRNGAAERGGRTRGQLSGLE